MANFSLKPVHFIILGVILGLGGFFFIMANPFMKTVKPFIKTSTTPKSEILPGAVPLATPTLILPKGRQTFRTQGGDADVSKVTQVIIDPLDAKKGDEQKIDVVIDSVEPVTSFTLTLISDNKETTLTMKNISGDSTKGTWSTSHTLSDSTDNVYKIIFDLATNTNKKTNIPFPLR